MTVSDHNAWGVVQTYGSYPRQICNSIIWGSEAIVGGVVEYDGVLGSREIMR